MPEFAYTARNMQGTRVEGVITATSERDALSLLTGQSLFPTSVSPAKQTGGGFIKGRRPNGQLLSTTYAQLAGLLRSGVPLLKSVAILREQTSQATLKEVLGDIYTKLEEGTPLADAFGRHPRIFGEMATNMVRAGAEGGFLEDALERVAQFTEQQEDLKGRTLGALAYPIFLGTVGSLVVAALLIFFVPKFATLFDSLRAKGELPAVTDWLLWFSESLRDWGWIALLVGVVVGAWLRSQLRTEEGRLIADRLRLRAPMLGSVFQNLAVARFCRVLGTMLKNGVPILKSLEISREAAGNRVLSNAIQRASENISAGQSLAGPLSSSGYFPRTVVEMIAVAEESNSLDRVLVDIADGLEKRTFRRLDLIVRLIEPLMLLILAAVVLVVVIALLIPVVKMSATV